MRKQNLCILKRAFLVMGCLLALLAGGCCNTLGKLLGKYGYIELRPPSTLLSPGTMITVEDEDPLKAGIICPQEASLGASLEVKTSNSSESKLAKEASTDFSVDAKFLTQLKESEKYSSIESVKLSLSNVVVHELPDSTVFEKVKNRSDSCVEAIKFRRAQDQDVAIVKSVLAADVVYVVEFSAQSRLEASVKETIVKDLAAELGVKNSTVTSNSIQGTGLFWGIKPDTKLARIGKDGSFKLLSKEKSIEDIQKAITSNVAATGKAIAVVTPAF
ncbi:MAG: hypothetical protein ACREIJ_00995 [Nitrospiraceae bacterium]